MLKIAHLWIIIGSQSHTKVAQTKACMHKCIAISLMADANLPTSDKNTSCYTYKTHIYSSQHIYPQHTWKPQNRAVATKHTFAAAESESARLTRQTRDYFTHTLWNMCLCDCDNNREEATFALSGAKHIYIIVWCEEGANAMCKRCTLHIFSMAQR